MKRLLISALALVAVWAMVPAEVSAQFRVVKDGKAILVMEDEVPDYVDFEVGAQEDGHLTLEQLMAMTKVTVDKTPDGKNGNVLTCSTTAPVNVKWSILPGYGTLNSNHFTRKMDVGEYMVILDALCADGTKLKAEYTVKCDVETAAKEKVYIYGEHPEIEAPFKPGAWNAAAMRFSSNESRFIDVKGEEGCLPYISDEVYWGFETLIFDISDATDDCAGRIMNGWWSARYDDYKDVKFTNGQWELQLTEAIANDCARGNGGDGKDLDLMITQGSCTINAIYYYGYGNMKSTNTAGKAVDMGLSVKWSNVNIGASSPEQFGDYYAWGKTKPGSWTENTYKKNLKFVGDNKITLEPEDDAAHVNWGGDWVMPSPNDFAELINNCAYEWTTQNGVNGYLIKGTNGNSIFLPAAGYRNDGSLDNEGSSGYYWSSSLDGSRSHYGRNLYFGLGGFDPWNYYNRFYGFSVRPVCPSSGNTNGHEGVDLGLPSGKLWATCNVGAGAPEESGSYFAWGETATKEYYDWSTYRYIQGGENTLDYINKYQVADGTRDGIWYVEKYSEGDVLDAEDDIATALWGDEWRMPTAEEWQELDENTTKEWANDYFGTGVSGYILTSTKPGYENAYIFLPAAGYRSNGGLYNEGLYNEGSDGCYWSSSLSKDYSDDGRSLCFCFYSGRFFPWSYSDRFYGFSVRPVCPSAE